MIKLKRIKKSEMPNFRILDEKAIEFNAQNESLFKEYDNLNIIGKFFAHKYVRYIFIGNKPYGFLWYEPLSKGHYYVKSLYFFENPICKITIYDFYNIINRYKIKNVSILSDGCNYADSLLKQLKFNCISSSYELEFDTSSYEYNMPKNIVVFMENRDEKIRCKIQNEVFHNEKRIPLTISDIYREENQEYYIDGGGIFITVNNFPIGYGQIVREDDAGMIVNVGIISQFRGCGYGRTLIKSIISLGKELGFDNLKIKTDIDNIKAYNLYKSVGFIDKGKVILWNYNRE